MDGYQVCMVQRVIKVLNFGPRGNSKRVATLPFNGLLGTVGRRDDSPSLALVAVVEIRAGVLLDCCLSETLNSLRLHSKRGR